MASWVVEFRCLNILPPRDISVYYRRILPNTKKQFNGNKKGPGRQNFIFRACHDIWHKASNTYFGGTHSDLSSLSINKRPAGRNGQALEGIHVGTINLGKSDANQSAKGSDLRFFNTTKLEEVGFTTRDYQIKHLNSKPKTKNKAAIKKIKP